MTFQILYRVNLLLAYKILERVISSIPPRPPSPSICNFKWEKDMKVTKLQNNLPSTNKLEILNNDKALQQTSSTTTRPRVLILPASIKAFTRLCPFSIVAMYTDFFCLLLIGGILPLFPAYSSTRKPSSIPKPHKLPTWEMKKMEKKSFYNGTISQQQIKRRHFLAC